MDEPAREALRTFVERALRFQWPALVLLAWTSRRVFGSLFSALEQVFGVPGRGFASGNLLALGTVLAAGLGLLITMSFTMVIATSEGLVERFAGPVGADALRALVGVRHEPVPSHRDHVHVLLPHLSRRAAARGRQPPRGSRAPPSPPSSGSWPRAVSPTTSATWPAYAGRLRHPGRGHRARHLAGAVRLHRVVLRGDSGPPHPPEAGPRSGPNTDFRLTFAFSLTRLRTKGEDRTSRGPADV